MVYGDFGSGGTDGSTRTRSCFAVQETKTVESYLLDVAEKE
jgi:hypothetical protein